MKGEGAPSGRATSAAVPAARVLLVASDPAVRRGLARLLLPRGHQVFTAEGAASALALLTSEPLDVAVIEAAMTSSTGGPLLEQVRAAHPAVEVVALGAAEGSDPFADALARGAYDVVVRPLLSDQAPLAAIERAAERRRLLDGMTELARRLAAVHDAGELIGTSRVMREVERLAAAAASTSGPVLLVGEPGVGKQLVARTIHAGSRRAERPLYQFDAQAVPEARHEEELFGDAGHPGGLVAEASGATLLVLEIGALAAAGQRRLLDLLDAREPRLLATSSVEPKQLAAERRLHDDLRIRLASFVIHIPPLRQRRDDLPLLAHHLLRRAADRAGRPIERLAPGAMKTLREHRWPGNLDELEQALAHAVVVARTGTISPGDLPPLGVEVSGDAKDTEPPLVIPELLELPYAEAKRRALLEFDRAYLEAMLARAGGNISEAARLAGLDRSNFRRTLKKSERA